jgi:hypothetical protein
MIVEQFVRIPFYGILKITACEPKTTRLITRGKTADEAHGKKFHLYPFFLDAIFLFKKRKSLDKAKISLYKPI